MQHAAATANDQPGTRFIHQNLEWETGNPSRVGRPALSASTRSCCSTSSVTERITANCPQLDSGVIAVVWARLYQHQFYSSTRNPYKRMSELVAGKDSAWPTHELHSVSRSNDSERHKVSELAGKEN
ncbi:uncharacterized protein LOC128093430 [Culex pipiens pallens]|uniref:uncharacterized protein LOC128093430 n=1 Tax=Culex pipiens pallens TaxID=42434 RepID=UPI0022AA266E|nr:uncharacterized protein LOC128093430 [Culex pipiens pallens]